MSDNTKSSLIKLAKTVFSALVVFVSSIFADKIGASDVAVSAVTGAIGAGIMLA